MYNISCRKQSLLPFNSHCAVPICFISHVYMIICNSSLYFSFSFVVKIALWGKKLLGPFGNAWGELEHAR